MILQFNNPIEQYGWASFEKKKYFFLLLKIMHWKCGKYKIGKNLRNSRFEVFNLWRLTSIDDMLQNWDYTFSSTFDGTMSQINPQKWDYLKSNAFGLPGGTVVKNPSANAGDMGSSPEPGRSYMLQNN